MKFDLHRLRLLYELEQRGTLTAVAAALSYSPSTISQQLSILENEVGTTLLEHVGRRVRLTPQGRILVQHTASVLQQLQEADAQIASSLGETVGTLRIAAFQTAMLSLVPPVLTWLHDRYPGLRVEVTQAEPSAALHAQIPRDFDLAIHEVYPGHPLPQSSELHEELLIADPIRLVVPATGGALDRGGDLSAYADSPWVMELPGSPARAWTVAACRNAGFEPDIVYDCGDMFAHAQLVADGHAVAFLPDLMWLNRSPNVTRYGLSAADRRRIVTICALGMSAHPKVKAARAALLAVAGAGHS
ncbi:DNA-binding transcriptional LysR family regulator [Mycobacterium frederiksbergense]|jgi:DNA-binding transcriptional LysR family regulator|uniref:DNA-binding transcriptional LysR family regulator n=1 Tax=Mycolicibacterium frederiksbergense TaxID=117567 RepID=A0ABT6KZ02_9MYCO|nr:LysR family transcriptional regulator [Mycolicibacterium frederiksbergense]MDH6195915.1 DNA-binding transcriptional LysR family regulator [Mycolicibacterium frederiksbergense]